MSKSERQAIAAAFVALLVFACTPETEPNAPPMTAERATEGTRLALTGDVMLGRGIDQIQAQSVDPALYERYVRSALGYVGIAEEESGPIPRDVGPDYVWGDAIEAWKPWDPEALIVNLETAVTTRSEPWPGKGIHYRMHPGNAAILSAAGVDCAVLANNHVLDWRSEGLLETLRVLTDVGIAVAGAGEDLSAASAPAVLPVAGGRVLVLAAGHPSSGVLDEWAATGQRPGVRLLPDLSARTARALAAEIRATRRPGDLVVVSIHWGGNWGYSIPAEQKTFARTLVDEGAADVVHGHSSHHPKGMEVHGDRLILYGAGDLINDYEGIGGQEEYRPRLSLLYLPRLGADGALADMVLLPFRIDRFRLRRASSEETSWLRDRLARESRGIGFEVREGRILARSE